MINKSISVCIPTYNGALYIEEQLRSIISQLRPDDEIIISDDHSTDSTIQKLIDLKEPRIKIFTNKGTRGPIYNAESALKHAKGDLIFLSDQDDVWYPEKIAVMMPFLENYNLVISDATVIDRSGNIIYPSFFSVNKSAKGFLRNWYRNSFLGCCMAFDRGILNYVIPFPAGIAMHDIWIGLNAALIGKYYLLPKPLIHYRRHGNNASPTAEKSGFTVSYMIWYRLYMMYHIVLRRLQHAFKH